MTTRIIKNSIEVIILQIIKIQGPMHGYALNNKIKSILSGMAVTSSIYRSLHRLKKEKILVTVTSLDKNRLRIYYALTPKGKKLVKQKTDQLNKLLETVSPVINSDN